MMAGMLKALQPAQPPKSPAGKPKGEAKAKVTSKKIGGAGAGGKHKGKAAAKPPPKSGQWKFPGIPKNKADPMEHKNFKIYTSLSASAWRVLKKGEVVDKPFKWTGTQSDAKESWSKMLAHIGA